MRQQQDLRVREVAAQLQHHGADALGDFRRGVGAVLLVPIISITALGWKPCPSPFRRPHSTPCVVSPAIAKLAVRMRAEVLVEHRLVRLALDPPVGDRIAVQQQVDVALLGALDEPFVPGTPALDGLRERRGDVLARPAEASAATRTSSAASLVGDLSASMNRFTAALTCASSSGVGRGMATSGGTGAGGPMTTGATAAGPGPGSGGAAAGAVACASATPDDATHTATPKPTERHAARRMHAVLSNRAATGRRQAFNASTTLPCTSVSRNRGPGGSR